MVRWIGWSICCLETLVACSSQGNTTGGTTASGPATSSSQNSASSGSSSVSSSTGATTSHGLSTAGTISGSSTGGDHGSSSSGSNSGSSTTSSGSNGGGSTGSTNFGGDAGPGACGDAPVPAEAAAAGFATCAYNYDFSQPLYATESNWLDWSNTNSNVPWHNGWPGGLSRFQDGNVTQATDPTYGQTVLDMKWDSAWDGIQTGNNTFLSIQTIMNGGSGSGQTADHPVTFPNFYSEATYRIDDISAVNPTGGDNTSGPDGVWTWQVGGYFEFDFAELYGNAGGFADSGGHSGYTWVSYSSGIGGKANIPSSWGPTSYHKYGSLFTTDGKTAQYSCSWIDDVFQSCKETTTVLDYPNWLVIWVGGTGANTSQLPTTNLYVQSVRVWSCPSWQSSKCDGTTLETSQQSGTTLSYWK